MLAPHGFKEHASGLVVPEELSRTRQVWTKAERKLHDRHMALLQARGLKLMLQCGLPDCPEPTIKVRRLPGAEVALQCGCTDRRFVDAF